MTWHGQFVFGEAFAAYFGPAGGNDLHEHAAYQMVLSGDAEAIVVDEAGSEHRGGCLLIRPLVSHAIHSEKPLTLIYLDPQSTLAMDLANQLDPYDISVINEKEFTFGSASTPEEVLTALYELTAVNSPRIDPRLNQALSDMRAKPGGATIAEMASRCGISESRLRVIAREQFGIPLSTWLIWRKLECSAKALSTGVSLADAALVGGFSDQAHFTRAMRRMFGITPNVAAQFLRNQV